MTRSTNRFLAVLGIVLLSPFGCAAVRTGPDANAASPVVKELVKTGKSWNGESLPAYPPGQPEVTILRIRIPAGARLPLHSHPVINAGVLLSGQLTVVAAGGKTLHLEAGDPIVEVVNTPHYGINKGTIPAEIIVVYAGVAGSPITVAEPR